MKSAGPALLSAGESKKRIIAIDALRGLAVVLMLIQHVVYWVCGELHASMAMPALGALGGLAAPIFLVLAGTGVVLAETRHENIDRVLAGRGLIIMGLGYLLNLLTPNWFALESWYVLHMIGFGLLAAPVLRRIPGPVLVLLVFLVIGLTALVQTGLNTPLVMGNRHMASTRLPGGIFRLALAEGFFPVFPWIAFFMAGLVAGRQLVAGRLSLLGGASVLLFAASALFSGVYLAGFDFARHRAFIRFFKPIPSFYPALVPVTFFLIGAALLLVYVFVLAGGSRATSGPAGPRLPAHPLACLGRCSLTILMVHIPLIREPVVRLGIWRSFTVSETLGVTLAVLIIFFLAVRWWRSIDFRYGAEWLLRRAFP